MNLREYQIKARGTAIYLSNPNNVMLYPALGLIGETGELAEKIKKLIRDDNCEITDDRRGAIKGELGDCMWYCANICCDTNNDLMIAYQMRGYAIAQYIMSLTTPGIIFQMMYSVCSIIKALEEWISKHNRNLIFCDQYIGIPQDITCVVVCIKEMAQRFGTTLEDVCETNIFKLADRKARNVIKGDGDSR